MSKSSLRRCFDRHDCEKGRTHSYERLYEPEFEPIRHLPLRLLEIGIWKGASLAAWIDYFPSATIVGIDTFQRVDPADVEILRHPRVEWHQHDSRQPLDIGHFDIVIDDGLHTHTAQRQTFEQFGHCADRYYIEDVFAFGSMTNGQKAMNWLQQPGYSDEEYAALLESLGNHRQHDLRSGFQPDSFIISKCE